MSNPNKVYQTPLIVVIKDDVVDVIHVSTPENCERDFLANVQSRISNWEEYTQEDIDAIIEQGYELTGNGSVCLTWVDKAPEPVAEDRLSQLKPELENILRNLQGDLNNLTFGQIALKLVTIETMLDSIIKKI